MRTLAFGFLLLILTACGAAAPASNTGSDTTGTSSAGASTAASTAPSNAPSAAPSTAAETPTGSGSSVGDAGGFNNQGGKDAVEQQALAQLSTLFNKPASAFTLQDRTEKEWSDSSLGCPDPATMYMQVITPGFQLTYTDGTRTYQVNTNEDGSRALVCDNGKPQPRN